MATVKLLTLLMVVVSTVAFARCSVSELPDCSAICQHLQLCQYLPSILGASSSGQESPQSDCEARCKNSSDTGPYRLISNCHTSYPTNEECVNFGQCLRAHFPGTPITGVSNVNAQSKDKLSLVILSNGGCDEDAGIARSFVETWGVRRYSDTRSCSLRLIDFFDNVSADMQGQAGLQFGTQFSGAVHNERKGRRAGLGADRATGNACRRGCNAHLERTFGSQATPPGCPR